MNKTLFCFLLRLNHSAGYQFAALPLRPLQSEPVDSFR
jgi:hypothetical protein